MFSSAGKSERITDQHALLQHVFAAQHINICDNLV